MSEGEPGSSRSATFFGPRAFSIGLLIVGLLPALVILGFIQLQDGELMVTGRPMAEYDLTRLFAGLLSLMSPILLLSPLALNASSAKRNICFWLSALGVPFFLLAPSLLAGMWVGGSSETVQWAALVILSALVTCFVLWLEFFRKYLELAVLAILYGLIWSVSGFLGYLSYYILPVIDIPGGGMIEYLDLLIPQLVSGPAAIDDYLQSGRFEARRLLPTIIHIPLFALLLGLRATGYSFKRGRKKERPPESGPS